MMTDEFLTTFSGSHH